MKTKREVRDYLRQMRKGVTSGLWGRWGFWSGGSKPLPHKSATEIAPGLSIGSTGHIEALARFNGYQHDCQKNADYVSVLVNHIEDLLDDLDELEEENSDLLDLIERMKKGRVAAS